MATFGIDTQRHRLQCIKERFIFEVRILHLCKPIARLVLFIREACQLVARLLRLEVQSVGSELIASALTRAPVDESAQVVLGGAFEGEIEDLGVAEGTVDAVSGATQRNLRLHVALLRPPTHLCVNLCRHFSGEAQKLFVAAEPLQFDHTLEF